MVASLSKRLYHSNLKNWSAALSKKFFSDRELGVKTIDNGIILPAKAPAIRKGGVCDSNFKFVAGLLRSGSAKGWGNVLSSYTVARDQLVHSDEDVIFGGVMMGHFGHFISECLIRLWYVLEHPEMNNRIAFIASVRGKKEFHYALFELMGIPRDRVLFVERPTQFKSVLVPDVANFSHQYFTKEWLVPYQAVAKNVTPGNVKKLYLTRTAFEGDKRPGVHCFGEKYFEDYFIKKGYTVVSPERLSLKNQIELILGADEIASTLGSLSHFSLFCKPGTKFIMLDRADNGVVGIQCLINEATDIDWYIVDASKNFLHCNRYTGACLLGSTLSWKQFTEDHFGDHIEVNNDKFFFGESLDRYVKFWLKKYAKTAYLQSSLSNLCNSIAVLENQVPIKSYKQFIHDYLGEDVNAAHLTDVIKRLCARLEALKAHSTVDRPIIKYELHVARKGWLPACVENSIGGFVNQQLRIEALKITFSDPFNDVYYSVYYPKEGWTKEVSTGQPAGTTGKSKPIFGLKIRLDDAGGELYDILYRVHNFNGKWSPWMKNGEELISQDFRLNAVQIKLEDKIKMLAPPPLRIEYLFYETKNEPATAHFYIRISMCLRPSFDTSIFGSTRGGFDFGFGSSAEYAACTSFSARAIAGRSSINFFSSSLSFAVVAFVDFAFAVFSAAAFVLTFDTFDVVA